MVFSSSLGRKVEETRSKAGRHGERKIKPIPNPIPNPTKKLLGLTTKIFFRRPNISHKADAGNAPAQQETINICPRSHGLRDYLRKHKVNGSGYPC